MIGEMLKITTRLATATFKAKPDEDAFKRPATLDQLGVHYRWSSIVYDGLREGDLQVESTNVEPPSTYGVGEQMRLQAGDRAPDAPGLVGPRGETTLFNFLNVARHTVIVFNSSCATTVRAAIERYPAGQIDLVSLQPEISDEKQEDALVDAQGHAYRAYGAGDGVAIAIVRPDGVVGALLKEEEEIEVYFSRVFAI